MMMMIGGNNQVITQNEGGASSGMNNKGGREGGLKLKKGPWTAAEDVVLAEYVRTHGEGNWNAVQKNTGLARCGKSCRLRWANHLRPNLKKGAFSPEEERIIVELHAKMGNKWARMAAQLPGRTDNEIKNYWNTRVKRKQRQGLPLYPSVIQPLHHSQPATPIPSTPTTSASSSSFSFQTPTSLDSSTLPAASHPLHIPRSASQPLLNNPHSSTTTAPHVSPLQSPQEPAAFSSASNSNATATTPDIFFHRTSPTLETPFYCKRFKCDFGENYSNNSHDIAVNGSNNGGSSFMFPFSPLLKPSLFNPQTATSTSSLTPPHFSSYSLDPVTLDLASSSTILHPHTDSGQFIPTPGFVYPLKTELPSNQLSSQVGNNYSSSNDHNNSHCNFSLPDINGGGLLENMVEEAQVFAGSDDILRRQFGFNSSSEGFTSASRAKEEETPQHMNIATHEDYSRILNVIPCSMPIPDQWFIDKGQGSYGQSSVIITDDDNLGHHIASPLPISNIAADHHGSIHGSQSWDKLPGIC